MDEGIYELLVTSGLDASLRDNALLRDVARIDKGDQPHILARHIAAVIATSLADISNPTERIDTANALLRVLDCPDAVVVDPPKQLLRLYRTPGPGIADRTSVRPATPLSDVALLTNAGHGEPSIGHEVPAEMASADAVDLLCAFIKWSGVRLLESQLRSLHAAGKPLRVVTTTYLGSTERTTLDRLVREYGAQVRVQYDAQRTRLHAKAWMFRRDSGFDTAYVGSSNLSSVALVDGVEWNVRLSRVVTPGALDRFESMFETYWNDPAFEEYVPDRDRDRLDDALAVASGKSLRTTETLSISGLQVRPFPYQQVMLEEIWSERLINDRHWNLVVAATGTGKTVLAALDYRHLADNGQQQPNLLFIAHRKEILQQALRTFREVCGDGAFGELYVDGARPERWRHVFASVQSLHSYGVENIPAQHFDVVIIDEFHHAEAATYRRVIGHLTPQELLGLTATPERSDGTDIRRWFDGRIATELRLWDALDAQLLTPFHYFGIADGTDLATISWRRGAYDVDQLEELYTGSDARVRIVLRALAEKVTDPRNVRALGFCVSVGHARFMAHRFNAAGIHARAVHGGTSSVEREASLRGLRDGSIQILFSVDVFNEGLDLPDVDTILMLRPTESATVFLQQLGRGLRSTPTKAVLTVLDFVGNQRAEFRWDRRLRAMTGRPRGRLINDVENGFPYLPSGCRVVLDELTQRTVLTGLKRQLAMRWPDMVAELRNLGAVTLGEYLADTGLALTDIVKSERSWSRLRRDAQLDPTPMTETEARLLRRMRAFAHVTDPLRREGYKLLSGSDTQFEQLAPVEQTLARMLFFNFFPDGGGFSSLDEGLEAIRSCPAVGAELGQIVDIVADTSRQYTYPINGTLGDMPLRIHGRYNREEILAALGAATMQSRPSHFREGVKYVRQANVDALFVTLAKTESSFSPTTMYRDYPISRQLFRWDSQSTTTKSSPTGRRYLDGSSTVLLFVRPERTDTLGPMPYLFLGPATAVDHHGDRPIAITWRLDHEMPAEFFNDAKVATA